jgi:hypothetical protein
VDEGTKGVHLLGNGSKDSDGTIVSHLWTQVPASDTPSVTLTDKDKAIAIFDAPSLKVTDNDGAVDEDTVVVTVVTSKETVPAKDTTPPDTLIESAREGDNGNNKILKDGDSTFSKRIQLVFSGKDNVDNPKDLKFECRLIGEDTDADRKEGQFEACESPVTYTRLNYGEHSFEVRAIDSAGNADQSPDTFTWIISKQVDIDIKPNDTDNWISLNMDKTISVAILGTNDFKPGKQVDKHSLKFGPEAVDSSKADDSYAAPSGTVTSEDVNKDGFTDLVSRYNIDRIGFSTHTTNACLRAETEQDQNGRTIPIMGCDKLKVEN